MAQTNRFRIVDFAPEHAADFKRLNVEWITQHWTLEAADRKALDDPDNHILKPGGAILMALYQGEAVGSVALIPYDESTLELAKMAVSSSTQGRGFGKAIAESALARARTMGARRVYLESNTVLAPALALYRRLGFTEVLTSTTASPYARCNIRMEKFIGA